LVKIKILYIIPSFRTGGAEVQLLTLIKGLDKALFDVTVAAFYRGQALDSQFESVPGVKIVYLEKKGGLDFRFLSNLKKLFQQKYDVVQPYNISARFFGLKFARRFNVPVSVATERSAKPLYTSVGSRIYLFLERFAMKKATVVVPNSEAGRAFVISRGIPKKITRVIYNGIDPLRISVSHTKEEMQTELSIPKNSLVVGTVGRIEEQKDPVTLLKAAELVNREFPKTFFVFVGDGPIKNEMQTFAKELGIIQNCRFVGNQKNVANFVNLMDVFVLVSKTIEGCSNAILEAMNLGKPIIATDVGGNREVVIPKSFGDLVLPEQPLALAEKIISLLKDDEKRATFSKNAAETAAKNYSMKAMVEQYQNLYKELLSLQENKN
jgi:glycosyltransferase involved in cell wall biosynthesis